MPFGGKVGYFGLGDKAGCNEEEGVEEEGLGKEGLGKERGRMPLGRSFPLSLPFLLL